MGRWRHGAVGGIVAVALIGELACNALTGVGDYAFDGASGGASTSGRGGATASGSTVGSTASNGGAATGGAGQGGTTSAGGMGGTTAAGGAGPTFQVPCAAMLCPVKEVCCVQIMGGNSNVQLGCAAPGGCPMATDFEVTCDGPEDCQGADVCCGHYTGTHWDAISCLATCTNFAGGERVMCGGPGAPNMLLCTNMCLASNALSGYYYCN